MLFHYFRVLQIAAQKKLLSGKTVAVDSTTLEANAAMKTIIRHDTGEDWKAYSEATDAGTRADRERPRADRRRAAAVRSTAEG